MSLIIIITDAGRAALVNAEHTGTAPVAISEVGISAAAITPLSSMTVLTDEIKRLSSIAGEVVAADTIHVSMTDATTDAYTLRSFGLYLADGTLFGIYGQADPILEKTSHSIAALAIDVVFADIDATSITFGDASFSNPPATTDRQGVVELATNAEALAGADTLRALTPAAAKAAVLSWLLALDGHGSGLDADMVDGKHASEFLLATAYTAADVLTKLMSLDGSGSGIDADMLDGLHASSFATLAGASSVENGGFRIYADGYRECWGKITIPANAQGYFVAYPAGVGYASWSNTQISGARDGGNAQDNAPDVKNCTKTGFTVSSAADEPIACWWSSRGY